MPAAITRRISVCKLTVEPETYAGNVVFGNLIAVIPAALVRLFGSAAQARGRMAGPTRPVVDARSDAFIRSCASGAFRGRI